MMHSGSADSWPSLAHKRVPLHAMYACPPAGPSFSNHVDSAHGGLQAAAGQAGASALLVLAWARRVPSPPRTQQNAGHCARSGAVQVRASQLGGVDADTEQVTSLL